MPHTCSFHEFQFFVVLKGELVEHAMDGVCVIGLHVSHCASCIELELMLQKNNKYEDLFFSNFYKLKQILRLRGGPLAR